MQLQGFERVPLKKLLSGHYRLNLRINGNPATLILDTGASTSCIGFSQVDRFDLLAEQSDLKATGAGASELETRLAIDVRLELTKKLATTTDVVLFDLTHINGALESVGETEVDGILGADLLKTHRAVIDYGRNALYLKK